MTNINKEDYKMAHYKLTIIIIIKMAMSLQATFTPSQLNCNLIHFLRHQQRMDSRNKFYRKYNF